MAGWENNLRSTYRALSLATTFLLGNAAIQAADDRYAAWLADGTKVTAKALTQWPVPGLPHRMLDRDLMAAGNPVRFVRDRQAEVELAAPYIVMANGDVLGGTPVQLAAERQRLGQTARLEVQLEAPLLPVTGTTLTVRTERIRRMVLAGGGRRTASPYVESGLVVLADGRRLAARSIRWREFGLAVLTPEGVSEVSFGDLAEVVFPGVDVTAAVVDDNLWAGSATGPAIARLQMTNGTVVTASRISREQEESRRRGRVTSAVYYYVQPAWAEEPLALPEEEIAAIGYRAADEAPLSLLPGQALVERRLLSQATSAAETSAARGEAFVTNGRSSDLGLAAHAESAIAIALPPEAKTLEVAVGFDVAAGRGGCVRCKVVGEHTLWDSGVFEGKDGLKKSGAIDVAGIGRVMLVTEFAHEDRPAGADPFDIRDSVVWLAPVVKLDLGGAGTGKRVVAMLPGAAEWELAGAAWERVQIGNRWNLPGSHWDPLVTVPTREELKLTRRHRVALGSDIVELLTACPIELEDHDFELTVNGVVVPWHNNADRNQLRQWVLKYGRQRAAQGDEAAASADRLAYWWDLQAWRGQEVTLELALRGRRAASEIAWRNLAIRSAVGSLPDDDEMPVSDVPLLSLSPLDSAGQSERTMPLADAIPRSREGAPIRFFGQRFTGGYGLARSSRISFALQSDFAKFVAIVGCCEQTAGPVRVLIDGRVAWERLALNSLIPAEQVEINIPMGAKTLTLESGAEGTHYGFSAFANAGFERRK